MMKTTPRLRKQAGVMDNLRKQADMTNPTREILGHRLTDSEIDRFWNRVDRSADCWRWGGAPNNTGYGVFAFNHTSTSAHRVSYTLLVGAIPTGLHIDHLCQNKLCVNPAHLEPVTIAVNNRRKSTRTIKCTKGHVLTGANVKIYDSASGWRQSCVTCKSAAGRKSYALRLAKAG